MISRKSMQLREQVYLLTKTRRLCRLVSMCALLSLFLGVVEAGLYTGPYNPNSSGADSAWSNPAGMTSLKAATFFGGVGGVFPIAKFKADSEAGGSDGDNSGVNTVLPAFFAVAPVSKTVRLGLSVFAPLGGPNGMGWKFDDDWAGRYGSQGFTFTSMAIAPSVAWQATDKWSIGGGWSFQWLRLDYSSAVSTPFEGDGKAELKDLTDWGGRLFLGTRYQASPTTSFGFVYRSKWVANTKGDLLISGNKVGADPRDFGLDLTLPQQAEVGVQHVLSPTWILDVNADWEDWGSLDKIVVSFFFEDGETKSTTASLNWHSTFSAGASLTHVIGTANFLVFGGSYASSPVDDDKRLIQLPVDDSLTLSLGFAHATKTLTASIGGAFIASGSAPVAQVLQGFDFVGQFDTNVAFALTGGIQW